MGKGKIAEAGWLVVSLPFVVGAVLVVSGCGGGGSSLQSSTPPPSPDFSLSASSTSLTIVAGSTVTASVTVTGSNGFNSPVTVGITGLPSGVSVSPTSLQVTPGQSGQLTFTAVPYLSPSTNSLTFSGSFEDLSHTATISLAVAPYAGNISVPRTRYTRTDAATEYPLWGNSNWIVFDSVTNRFFVTDPSTNQVMVLDAATQTEIGTIIVPGAFGIDETPDHTTLYVGTQIGDVYAIDPVGMKVVHRYIASEIGPNGYQAYSVRVLANGDLALLGGQGGTPGVDGYASFAVWNPVNNSITTYEGGGPNPVPIPSGCGGAGGIFGFTVSGDRTLIVFSRQQSWCTLNPVTGQFTTSNLIGKLLASTPDGKSLLLLQPGGATPDSAPARILVLDASTLSQKSSIQLATYTTGATAMFVSPDSTTVYIGAETPIVYAYNIATGAQVGWLPNLFLPPIVGGLTVGPYGPDFQTMDNTGLLAGPMEEGVGFLDTAALQTGPVGTPFLNAYLNPATGPATGGTQLQFPSSANLAALYFGKNLASAISPVGNNGLFEATTPARSPGYVDVYGMMTDGGMQILPEAFSYGPSILEVTPNSSTAEGGGTGILYGYGFGPTNSNTIPIDLQVMVGGKQVQITSYNPNVYGVETPPFLLQSVSYTIPAGVSGGSVDITVATQAGSATLSAGMSYLPATQQFPLSNAVLAQGIYDAKRDLYYFTDAAEIRVFSKTQGQWLTPIQVPAAPTGTAHRLWGIALSPDGSNLAVSDTGDSMIYLINPDTPGSAQSFPVSFYFAGHPLSIPGVTTYAAGLAVSDAGYIYFAAFNVGEGGDGFFKLDTATGAVTDYDIDSLGDDQYKVVIASDNSKVFFNNAGVVFSVDTATDKVSYPVTEPCCTDYDLMLSANQTTLEATSYLYDTSLNAESYLTLNDREALNITYVYGTKLSPDGRLLFQPSTNGIDIYDGGLGTLRSRIALPFALSQNYDALVGDGQDNVLIAVTGANGNGIAIVDLSSVSEPSPLPYLKNHVETVHPFGLNERVSLGALSANRADGKAVPPTAPRLVIKHVSNEGLARHR